MLNVRIIPRLDIKGSNVVKPVHTEALRIMGNPVELAQRYYNEGADEIIYMDIVASLYGRNLDFDLLRSVANVIFIPLTVGGGIRSIHDINNALRAGADKIAINTYATKNPKFISEAAKVFGSQCIVLSVEAKKIADGKWENYTDGGREPSGLDAIEWIKKGIKLGAGEVMITSIDRDGTRRGYDYELIKKITDSSPVPVIIYGGAGKMESFKETYYQCQPDAMAAGSVFHYHNFNIKNLKKYLDKNNIDVRLQ